MKSDIPQNWYRTQLQTIATKVGSGATPLGGSEAYVESGIPLIRSMNIHFDGFRNEGLVYLTDQQASALDGATVRAKDVLLNITGASIGRVATAPLEMDGARVNQHVCIIRLVIPIESEYLRAFLSAPAQQKLIMEQESGATRQALTKEKILKFEIPLPPLNEQRRIVAKLEDLQARSRRAKEALAAIPALLERYRQSVLAAAFRGDLTADWRAKHPDVEPASELLKRIRVERRKKWESKYPKKKYNEPQILTTTELPTLPSTWSWACVNELLREDGLGYGILKPGDYVPGGVLMLRVMDMEDNSLNDNKLFRVSKTLADEFARTQLETDDVLLSVMATIGKTMVVPPWLAGANVNRAIAVLKLVFPKQSQYLSLFFNSPFFEKTFLEKQLGTAQIRINLGDLSHFPVPIPPLAEMSEIAIRLERRVNNLRLQRDVVKNIIASCDSLNESILSRAFRGELVPQDPTDEPASVLLERIRAERAAQSSTKSTRTRGKATDSSTQAQLTVTEAKPSVRGKKSTKTK